ncbi:MAG: hypothetical protein R3F48_12785 [Candidatus Zixiibacteriota bacterium]
MQGYISAIMKGDTTTARDYWDAEYLQLCNRLGIEFEGVSAKYDCASPLYQYEEELKSGTYSLEVGEAQVSGATARIPLMIVSPTDTLSYAYHCRQQDGRWVISPVVMELKKTLLYYDTKFCRVYFDDSSRINVFACNELDRFIESTVLDLGISSERLQKLPERKIYYFLLDADGVEAATGFRTEGMYDIPSDAIFTSHLPHNHELTHLLMNLAVEHPSLYTAPFLQEGIACHFGGRWGRSPGIIKYIGFVNLNFGIGNLDQIMSFDKFHKGPGGADASYSISSLFIDYLIRTIGISGFLEMYKDLSGTGEFVATLSETKAKAKVSDFAGLAWEYIAEGFAQFWPRYNHFGVEAYDTQLPADTAAVALSESVDLMVWELPTSFLFEVDLSKSQDGGVLLITEDTNGIGRFASNLFAQHLANVPYAGERYGIKFTPAEIGVYDYYTDELLASYVYGFAMSAAPVDFNSSVYRFTVEKRLFGTTNILDCQIRAEAL